jgi:hypothetical protein
MLARAPMRAWLRRHPALALVLLNAAAIVALDQLAGRFTRVDPASAFRRPHPWYHHDLRPSVRATTHWGPHRYEVATNSLAFRDGATREVAPAGERRRVLLMGDSVTEGLGVPFEETFAGLLSKALAPGTEVLNAGVIGYSPKIYLAKTEYLLGRVGLEVDELVVFVDMSDVPNEILYDVWQPRDAELPPPPRHDTWQALRGNSLVLRAVDRLRGPPPQDVAWNFHGMPFAEDLDAPALRDPAFDDGEHWTLAYAYAAEGLRLASRHLGALADLCARRGLPLTLVVYPWPKNILAGELDHPQVAHWRAFAAGRGLRFVDLFPDFIGVGRDPHDTVARLFIEGDVHWNAAGHALVASRIAPLLREPR